MPWGPPKTYVVGNVSLPGDGSVDSDFDPWVKGTDVFFDVVKVMKLLNAKQLLPLCFSGVLNDHLVNFFTVYFGEIH